MRSCVVRSASAPPATISAAAAAASPALPHRCMLEVSPVRTLEQAEARLDRREPDHGHRVAFDHVPVVELTEEPAELVRVANLRVVVLDLVRRQLGDRLHL